MCTFNIMPCYTCVAESSEITADIPVTLQNDTSVSHTGTFVFEPLDGAPAPEQTEIEITGSGKDSFFVHFAQPGSFQYRIYQINKDENGIIYDDRVYTITITVRRTEGRNLSYTMWATINGEEKVPSIDFVNRDRNSGDDTTEAGPTDTETSEEKTSENETSENNTSEEVTSEEKTNEDEPSGDKPEEPDSPQTGDDSSLELCFVFLILSCMMAAIMLTEKKSKRK